jgi:hypothetical protein
MSARRTKSGLSRALTLRMRTVNVNDRLHPTLTATILPLPSPSRLVDRRVDAGRARVDWTIALDNLALVVDADKI